MSSTTSSWRAIALAITLLATGTAWPHGDEAHTGPVEKVQKPWGIAGDARPGLRTVRIRMLDKLRFEPAHVEVQEGETVRFVVTNTGVLHHELVIGNPADLEAHAAMMMKHPDMQHDEPYIAHVQPKKSGELVWTFNRPGEFAFACLVAGHQKAGMEGTISVAAASAKPK